DAITSKRGCCQLVRSDLAQRLCCSRSHHRRSLDLWVEPFKQDRHRVLILYLTQRESRKGSHIRVAVLGILIADQNIHQSSEAARISDATERENRPASCTTVQRQQQLNEVVCDVALVFVLNDFGIEDSLSAISF